jgi:hypothetical protein
MSGPGPSLIDVVADGTADAELAALLWLLVEGGVPVTVIGPASSEARRRLAAAVLSSPPETPWVLLDADRERPDVATLGARIRGGVRVGLTLQAADLRDALERLAAPPDGLPDDAVRRLGVVLVAAEVPSTAVGPIVERTRILAAHYLRPTERDSQGHVQRRPPAVLATWVPGTDAFDHFAWGLTPELADLVDRTQASFEELQSSRAAALRQLARAPMDTDGGPTAHRGAIQSAEPPRRPATAPGVARPSVVRNPLIDPHVH